MRLHYTVGDVQAQTNTLCDTCVASTVKRVGYIRQIVNGNARSGIDNTDIDKSVRRPIACDPDWCVGGVFTSIIDQVDDRAFKQNAVNIDNGKIDIFQADLLVRDFTVPSIDQIMQQLINVGRLQGCCEICTIERFLGQKGIDQPRKLTGIPTNGGKAAVNRGRLIAQMQAENFC